MWYLLGILSIFFIFFFFFSSAQESNLNGIGTDVVSPRDNTWFLFCYSGQVVIDAFRLINANMMVLGHEPRQTTSNLGHLNKPSIQVRPARLWPARLWPALCFNMHVNVEFLFLFQSSVVLLQGADPWTEQALLLHHHQLQEKWTRAKGVKRFWKSTIHVKMTSFCKGSIEYQKRMRTVDCRSWMS